MSLEINGRISKVLSIESGQSKAGKEWKKQSFIIDTGAQFNPEICFSLFGEDKINLLRNFGPGQEVKVSFNVSSREFNGKYYHNIDAWKIDGIGGATSSGNTPPPPSEEPPMTGNSADLSSNEEDDDLPF
ncbi:MAG: DUF3127 domain-containing protein [Bacteroidetes bacterium]|nr:MAG: DUF3127 domain-containing protein [Bacteroidota bacterium]MBL1145399.1 DUF3127 domain-containing protein [Bacteroidota bacterium]NOG58197.1 DUF3127 domain-containing protein [Bacteroidota bacterium]